MVEAVCIHKCYSSDLEKPMLYKPGQVYVVDEKDPWIQKHFEIPGKKKD